MLLGSLDYGIFHHIYKTNRILRVHDSPKNGTPDSVVCKCKGCFILQNPSMIYKDEETLSELAGII